MDKHNDGRRFLPKIKCPNCFKRVVDLPCKELKNRSQLVICDEIKKEEDIVLECPHCHKIIGLRICNLEKVFNI